MPRFIDLAGQRFGRLMVAHRVPSENNQTRWLCVCDCGAAHEVAGGHLRSGGIVSCGCHKRDLTIGRNKALRISDVDRKAHLRVWYRKYRETDGYQITRAVYRSTDEFKRKAAEAMREKRADPAFRAIERARCKVYELNRHRDPVLRAAYMREYWRERRELDPIFDLRLRLRARFAVARKRFAAGKKYGASRDIGINWEAIIKHLGPCPGNRKDWHVDHIKPLASFDFSDPTQIALAFAPENHQWLPAKENIQKGAKT